MTTRSIFAGKPTDLGAGLTVWLEQGHLRWSLDVDNSAYYKVRRQYARKSLKDEGEAIYGAAIKNRCAQFERIMAGMTKEGRFLNGCPSQWRWAIDRLHRMKEELFRQQIEASQRAKAWHAAQQKPAAVAAD